MAGEERQAIREWAEQRLGRASDHILTLLAEVERLEAQVEQSAKALLDAGELHLADTSTIYQLEHRIVPKLEVLVKRLADNLRRRVDNAVCACGLGEVCPAHQVLAAYEASQKEKP